MDKSNCDIVRLKDMDFAFLKMIRPIFEQSAKSYIGDIQSAAEKKDDEGLCRFSHKLLGACLTMGGKRLSDISLEIEKSGRNISSDYGHISLLSNSLDSLLEEYLLCLDKFISSK